MYRVSQLSHLVPVVFVQPQAQTWIKEADEKKRKKNTKKTCSIYVTKKQRHKNDWGRSHLEIIWLVNRPILVSAL